MDFLSLLFGFLYQCGDAFAFLVLAALRTCSYFRHDGRDQSRPWRVHHVRRLRDFGDRTRRPAAASCASCAARLPPEWSGWWSSGLSSGIFMADRWIPSSRPGALSLIATQGTLIVLGSSMPGVGVPLGSFTVGAYSYSTYRLVLIAAALRCSPGFICAFNKTRFGDSRAGHDPGAAHGRSARRRYRCLQS